MKTGGLRLVVLVLPALCALLLSTWRPSVRTGALRFDVARATSTLRTLTRQCPERRPQGACGARAQRIIEESLRSSGYAVLAHRFGPQGGRVSLMGVRAGRGAGEVVLAAHHDTVPGSPGALDDAAGVALVLEVARVLARRSDGHSIRFALFDGEEDGLLGSRAYVHSLAPAARKRLVAAIAVEMPGFRGGAPVLHTFPPTVGPLQGSMPQAQLLARSLAAARAADVSVAVGDTEVSILYQVLVRNLRVPFAADDMPFAAVGVPAFLYSDSSLTRFYPHYHQPTDTLGALDRRAFARSGRAVEAIVRDLAFGAPLDAEGSSQALALGTRVARGPLLWMSALLLLLPLASALRRARPGGPLLLGAGYLLALLGSLPTALVLVGPALALSPLVAGSRASLRGAKILGLSPLVAAIVVWVMAAQLGPVTLEMGVGLITALLLAVVGLVTLRPRGLGHVTR